MRTFALPRDHFHSTFCLFMPQAMRNLKIFSLTRLILVTAAIFGLTIAHAAAPIYPEPAAAEGDIRQALIDAAKNHKRALIDFGGDWCGDCKALDANFHKPENIALLDSGFVLVHVNVGHVDQNLDIAERYGIPLKKGVPALAVLDENGKVLFAQQHGEFEDMRHMDVQSVNDFLNKWKP